MSTNPNDPKDNNEKWLECFSSIFSHSKYFRLKAWPSKFSKWIGAKYLSQSLRTKKNPLKLTQQIRLLCDFFLSDFVPVSVWSASSLLFSTVYFWHESMKVFCTLYITSQWYLLEICKPMQAQQSFLNETAVLTVHHWSDQVTVLNLFAKMSMVWTSGLRFWWVKVCICSVCHLALISS